MSREEFEKIKKGDFIYKITDVGILELEVINIDFDVYLTNGDRFFISPKNKSGSKTWFCKKEQAEEFMKLQEINKIKKQKLYELELQLNKEYNIDTFFIKY